MAFWWEQVWEGRGGGVNVTEEERKEKKAWERGLLSARAGDLYCLATSEKKTGASKKEEYK